MFLRHWLRCIGSTAQMKGTPTTQCQISGTRISTRSTRWGKANMFNHWEKEFRVGRAKILCSWKLVFFQSMAEKEPGVKFVGRLASYKYFNMDQVNTFICLPLQNCTDQIHPLSPGDPQCPRVLWLRHSKSALELTMGVKVQHMLLNIFELYK